MQNYTMFLLSSFVETRFRKATTTHFAIFIIHRFLRSPKYSLQNIRAKSMKKERGGKKPVEFSFTLSRNRIKKKKKIMKSGDIKVYSNAKGGGRGSIAKEKKKRREKITGYRSKKGEKSWYRPIRCIDSKVINFVRPSSFFPPSNVLSIRVLFENYYARQ